VKQFAGTPLKGLTVLDLTRLLPGAVATQYLAEHGAEVIKIEQPGDGDYARTMNPVVFARTNAGKKSVVLDLKQDAGKQALLQLTARADILIEGFRPGVMARLGLAYSDLSAINRRLIFVSLSGYGQSGHYAGLAGHDINYIALGGVLNLNLPVIPGVLIADLVGGAMQSIIGILMALHERTTTGLGQHVDVSMLAAVESLLTIPLATFAETGREPVPGGETLSGRYACYNVYECKDARWIAVGALEPKFWTTLCRQLRCEELIPLQFEDDRQEEVKGRLRELFRTRDAEAWFTRLREFDCCVTPVRRISEVAAEIEPGSTVSAAAPKLGEHTDEILRRVEGPDFDASLVTCDPRSAP
jgi:crotonobetainyl-CoA:carnitine CoA-transferase CaiB-like acyl-CoA transferase